MKPKLLLVALLAVSISFLSSCKKDKSDDADQVMSTEEVAAKILGKWSISSVQYNNHYNGTDHKETYPGTATDYVEFKSDGLMYTSFRGVTDISTYKVKNDKVITIDDDPASIQEISDKVLRLYTKDETGTFGFTELMYNLNR
ncbi:lipocalin family protein [Flavisolibacter tropicus]|uniref:Lipocalin-like domain-containing protein n=1 Tax=Flavisolibacter tropicus TaxID=1492898 RepID=A0A172TWP9_9BACT|nr:lipocalin family protein [Flavisolibacter tropicus]ANE51426.1 hypothetical protein SY85_13845 [Flavisolibacter tropicus]